MTPGPRVLAIDYGERRVGLAVSDPLRIFASGIGTLENSPALFDELRRIAGEYDVSVIVVGLPLSLKGERGEMALRVEEFAARLRGVVPATVETLDERFTSVLAQQTIRALGVGKKKRREKAKVDELAAVHLLQGYLDART